MAHAIDTALFDLGGVLIDWNPRYAYREHFHGDEDAMERFLAEVCPPHWNHQMDAGRTFDECIAERQREFPEHAELIALWKSAWETMLKEPIHESVALLEQLRARGRHLYALTNWSYETFPVAHRRFPFLGWFEDIIVSGRERLAKPDPRIFMLAIERFGLAPDRTLFIDDSAKNVEAARGVGLHAVQFESPAALGATLREVGLL